MGNTLNPINIRKALKHLKLSDKIISSLIEKHGPCTINPSLDKPFHYIANSIVSQQLSAHAARSIKSRLLNLFGDSYFTPDRFLKTPPEKLRSTGLSQAKSKYIIGIATALEEGSLKFPDIMNCADEDVISRLTVFSGVGRWTAEMFLIFGLGRPDVLSVNDAGLRRGFKIAYQLQDLPSDSAMLALSEPWRPYRSVASWYLWRTLD